MSFKQVVVMKTGKKVAQFKVDLRNCILQFLMITKPMHKLTNQEINVLGYLLYEYLSNRSNFKREEDLWKYVFDYDTKQRIKDRLDMGNAVFQNILTALRKKKVLVDNRIVPLFIPNIDRNDEAFELTFRFILKKDG